MKGLTTSVTIILLVAIVISLAGSAYFFMRSAMQTRTAETFEIIDVANDKVIVRNIGTESIESFKSIVDESETQNDIEGVSIPPNSLGSVILLNISKGYHDLLLISRSISQRWKWNYLSDPTVDFVDFSQAKIESWYESSENWKIENGVYVQESETGEEYSYKDVSVSQGTYEMKFMFSGSEETLFTVASDGQFGSGVSTVFDKKNNLILVKDGEKVYKSAPYDFKENAWYSVKVEIDQNNNYKLYINGEHISSVDFTIPDESIKGTKVQLGTKNAKANFDNVKVGGVIKKIEGKPEITTSVPKVTTSIPETPVWQVFDFEEKRTENELLPKGIFLRGLYSCRPSCYSDQKEWKTSMYKLSNDAYSGNSSFMIADFPSALDYGVYPVTSFIPIKSKIISISFYTKMNFVFEPTDNVQITLGFYGDSLEQPVQTFDIFFDHEKVYVPAEATGITVNAVYLDVEKDWKAIRVDVSIDEMSLPNVSNMTISIIPNSDGIPPEPTGYVLIDKITVS
jgi:hypothetical protein